MSALFCVSASVASDLKEMNPTLGKELDFNDKDATEYQTVMDVLVKAGWEYDKLTAKQKEFAEKYSIWETSGSYWDVLGGGDGWYNAGGPESVSASSYLKSNSKTITYLPENIHDLNFQTAWVPGEKGAKGYGIGESVTYSFKQSSPRVTTIIIANGYVKSEKAYRENSRVKKLKMYIDGKPFAILNLKDVRREQIFKFEPFGRKQSDTNLEELNKLPNWTLKFEILEVYKGDKYDDTAISEIYFDGLDVLCLGAGTKILMSDNSLKNIESIQEGELIKSYDFKNKKLINSKVTKLISSTHSNLLKLKFVGNEIITTRDHPFWTENNVWAADDAEKANKHYIQKTKVEKLQIGGKVFIPEKNVFLEIDDIEFIDIKQTTYTIELSESDNYIANGLLVKTEIVK
ncbi:MAG: hypothetical protein LBH05_04680 [Deferribacteraceae bacterium]|nr:hypothetical protein [Deferribacteraceae bacterium]